MIIGPVVSGGLGLVRGLKWCFHKVEKRGEHKAISEHNQLLLCNHLDHHEKRLEPKINRIAEDVAYIRGRLEE